MAIGCYRQESPLEKIEVNCDSLSDTDLWAMRKTAEMFVERDAVTPGIQTWWHQIAHQLRSVESWRAQTLSDLERDAMTPDGTGR